MSRHRTLGWTRNGLLAAAVLSIAGCGLRVAGTETASDGELVWTFGEPGIAILSWPVVDAEGNMFVIAGTDAKPLQQLSTPDTQLFVYFDVSAVVLVSISPDGNQRWQRELAPAQVVGKQAPWRPAVGPSGDVWTCWAGELRRWGNDGALRWSAPGRCHARVPSIQPALAHDGTFYDIDDVTAAPGPPWLVPELRATSADGMSSWSRIIGEPRVDEADFADVGTYVSGVAIATNGRVISGCDNCVMGQNSVASFARSDGSPTVLYSEWLNSPFTNGIWYSAPVLGRDVIWLWIGALPPALYSVQADGSADIRDWGLGLPLVSDDAVVHWDEVTDRVLWDETYLDSDGFPGNVVGPVALLRSHRLLAGYSSTWVGGACFQDCGLFIVDLSGKVVWQHDGVAPGLPIPVVGDGYLVYIDDAFRLVKIDAPVEGLADGPWPILGGNPQGTRSVEGK